MARVLEAGRARWVGAARGRSGDQGRDRAEGAPVFSLVRRSVGIRLVARGEEYGERCTNREGYACGVVRRVAVTDGVCVETPEGDEFFTLRAVRKLLSGARE